MFEGLFRPGHLLIVLLIVVLVFGPSKLPQLGGALGKAIRDFKQAFNEPPREPASTEPKSAPPARDA
jgi:sec-independent protein translocase protein TatA